MPHGGDDEGHLTEEGLVQFLAGKLDRAASVALVLHLLRGCKPCCSMLAPIVVGPRDSAPRKTEEDRYDLPVARAIAAARAMAEDQVRGRLLACGELAEILAPLGDREELLQWLSGQERSPSWRWAWCELLLDLVAEMRPTDLQAAADLGEVAVMLAEDMAKEPYPRQALSDLQARAWMEYGNLLRAMGDFAGAEVALGNSRALLDSTESVLLGARLLDLEGSLFRDRRRFPQAMEVLEKAGQLYLRLGERHLAGRLLVKMGVTLIHAGEPDRALAVLEKALGFLDFELEPSMLLSLIHNRLLALIDAGRPEQAARALWRSRAAYKELGSELNRVKLLGLEGRIARDLGQLGRAERLFWQTKAGFERKDLAYDAALVSLDLAGVLLDQGKPGPVLDLVEEMLDTFRKLQIGREAVATVLILYQALLQGEATAELAREIAARLRNLDPQVPPQRPGSPVR